MALRPHYILIPLAVFAVAIIGSVVTGLGMDWYETLILPEFSPPDYVFGMVWTVIYFFTAVSAMLFWDTRIRDRVFNRTAGVWVSNVVLNIGWSVIFFGWHFTDLAVLAAGLLSASVFSLIILMWKRRRLSAVLLIPYFLWTGFAAYLAYEIWQLNM